MRVVETVKSPSLPTPLIFGAAIVSVLAASVLMPVASYPMVLAGILGVVAVGCLVFQPYWLWILLLTFLPFSVEISDVLGHGTNLVFPTEACVPLVALAILVRFLVRGKIQWARSWLHTAILIYFTIQFLTLVVSPLPVVTLKAFIRTTSYLLCGYLLTNIVVERQEQAKTLLKFLVLSTSILVVYGFYTQFIEGVSIYQDIAHPFFLNHCIYAAWVCFPLAFLLPSLSQPIEGKGKIVLFFALLGLGVLLSFVRGAWLGILGLVAYLWYRQRSALNLKFILVLVLGGILGIILIFALDLSHLFVDRFVNLFDRRYVTNESRIDRWMAALSMWATHPILGVGLGCYPDLYPQYLFYVDTFEGAIRMGAHSIFFEIMAETGTLGILAYGFIIFNFFRETRRLLALAGDDIQQRCIALGLEGIVVVYLIHGVVNNLGPSDKIDIALWATLGLAVRLRYLREKERANSLPHST
ncbi:MAG: O-antigen ligase family protein [Candidatus Omnitrophica bacterium]|nr:O-antigen ligase family protein [Candidatus Omnitrophota bacterium]